MRTLMKINYFLKNKVTQPHLSQSNYLKKYGKDRYIWLDDNGWGFCSLSKEKYPRFHRLNGLAVFMDQSDENDYYALNGDRPLKRKDIEQYLKSEIKTLN